MSHALQHLWITPSARESVVCQLKSWKHQQGRDNGAFKPSLPHVLNLKVRAAAAGGLSREDDSACAVKDFSHLADLLLGLQTVVKDGYIKVGPEMRDRVDRLSDRVVLLRNSAERTPGGRIPVQLIATLKVVLSSAVCKYCRRHQLVALCLPAFFQLELTGQLHNDSLCWSLVLSTQIVVCVCFRHWRGNFCHWRTL